MSSTIQDILKDLIITQLEAIDYDGLVVEIGTIISKRYAPEEIFDKVDLEKWAEGNGFVKGESK